MLGIDLSPSVTVDGTTSLGSGDASPARTAPTDGRRRFGWSRSTPYEPDGSTEAGRPGRDGTSGGEVVAGRLAKLSGDWAVVHGPTVGPLGATLDHLVVGPPGVFVLTSTPASGALTVYEHAILHDGHDTRTLAWARETADRARVGLGPVVPSAFTVSPVVVVTGGRPDVRSRPKDVVVVRDRRLRRLLRRRPGRVLSAEQVRMLADAACRPETWGLSAAAVASKDWEPPTVVAPHACTVDRSTTSDHDRLVVSDTDGRQLGWLDLEDQQLTVEVPGTELPVRMALSAWRAADMLD